MANKPLDRAKEAERRKKLFNTLTAPFRPGYTGAGQAPRGSRDLKGAPSMTLEEARAKSNSTRAQMEYQKSRATAAKASSPNSPARSRMAGQMEMEANADNDARRSPKSTPKAPTRGTAPSKPTSAPKSDMTFKQAFAAARKAGKGTFTWNGKKYTTELAKPAPKAGSKPSRGTSGGVRGRGK